MVIISTDYILVILHFVVVNDSGYYYPMKRSESVKRGFFVFYFPTPPPKRVESEICQQGEKKSWVPLWEQSEQLVTNSVQGFKIISLFWERLGDYGK
jgi:hypothetical protein